MSRRDLGVENLRVLLMFGICLLHSISQCGNQNRWISCPLCACVDAFVFITGYYGIKFRMSKLVRIYAIGFWCATISVFLPYFFGLDATISIEEILKTFLSRFWFLHAYAVLMFLSPLVNKNIEMKIVWPVLFLVFCWGGVGSIQHIGRLMPRSSGVTEYSGLTLLGVYIAARLCRKYDLIERLDGRNSLIGFILLYIIAGLGWYEYCSPIALGLAMIAFKWGQKIQIGAVGELFAPSAFSIYLLHSNPHGFLLMRTFEGFLIDHGISIFLSYFIVAATVFFVCALIDIPRRVCCAVFKCSLEKLCSKIDCLVDSVIVKLDKRISNSGQV